MTNVLVDKRGIQYSIGDKVIFASEYYGSARLSFGIVTKITEKSISVYKAGSRWTFDKGEKEVPIISAHYKTKRGLIIGKLSFEEMESVNERKYNFEGFLDGAFNNG